MDRKKVLELDKICRVCISERKDMRPLFSEKVAEMLMECTSVSIEPTEGWPDKICVQCVHSVSRCHAFKTLVERSDKELREYVKSLTVRVVIEDPQELKMQQLQQKQAKLLQLQQQQQALLAQQQEHRKLQQQQLERQQQKQQKSLQKQLQKKQKQKQLQEEKQKLAQQQLQQPEQKQQLFIHEQSGHQLQFQQTRLQQKKKPPTPRKLARHTKKQQSVHHNQQQQQHNSEPVALHAIVNTGTLVTTATRQTQQQQLLPTTAALPQQIVLPNGQVFTTAQIVTHSGLPHVAHMYNNSTAPTAQPLQQLTPQLIQTTTGQALQLIQQPNGQQTLQLVQIVPQQRQTTIVDMSDISDHQPTSGLIEHPRLDHSLVDPEDLDEDVDQLDCDTIVIKEEELHTQTLLASVDEEDNTERLSQTDPQEFEYLEDITVTTTAHQQLEADDDNEGNHQQRHHQQHLLGAAGDDEDIIEEIHMEEEMLEDIEDDDVQQHEMHVMNTGEDVEFEQHLMDEELQYTVIEYSDEIGEASAEVQQEIIHVSAGTPAADLNASMTSNISSSSVNNNNMNNVACTSKRVPTRKSSKVSASTSATRQLAVTAYSNGADEESQLDQKFIADFISQQTTSLGAGRYICNLCRQEFKQFKGLQNHMHSHSNWIRANCKKQPQCEICFKSFKGPGMLKMHMKTHQSAAKTPICNICQKIFKSKAILYRHRQTHQLRSYSCGVETCRKTFSNHPNLRMHMTKKHPNIAQPKYKCGECALIFDDVDVLHAHVQMSGHGVGSGNRNVSITGAVLAESVNGDVLTLQSGQQVKLDGMVSVSDVVVVTQA